MRVSCLWYKRWLCSCTSVMVGYWCGIREAAGFKRWSVVVLVEEKVVI